MRRDSDPTLGGCCTAQSRSVSLRRSPTHRYELDAVRGRLSTTGRNQLGGGFGAQL